VHAVRTHDDAGGHGAAVGELDPRPTGPVVLGDADALTPVLDDAWRERGGEHPLQRDPVHAVVRRAERFAVPRVHGMRRDDRAVVPAPEDECRRLGRHRVKRVAESQPLQVARRVGRQRDAGSDLAELRRLLVHGDRHAAPPERERERQPADPPAHDGDAQIAGHPDVYATAGVRAGASAKSYSNSSTSGSPALGAGCTMSSGLTALATSSCR
jgi:hypothetical protein